MANMDDESCSGPPDECLPFGKKKVKKQKGRMKISVLDVKTTKTKPKPKPTPKPPEDNSIHSNVRHMF